MNGRMYDPVVSRMLSPDNYIQAPDFSQSFNRYSYAWNNPLVFTDPDGEFIFTALLPGVGVFLDAACWGAVIGGAAGGYAGGFTGGYLMTGDVSAAHQAGMNGMITGAPIGGIAGGVGGYVAAKKSGINPWSGKPNNSAVIGGPQNRVDQYGKLLDSETISRSWPDDLPAYSGKDIPNPKAIEFNQIWMEQTIKAEYYIYDAGRSGYSPFYHGVELPTIQNYNYSRVYKVTYIRIVKTLIIYK
ncbi:MAG: hypothetical protein M0P09_08565 [Acholeplasmataceae bacterium]|nr:hypothetical protein [Acholeplasmataceae bacterium]